MREIIPRHGLYTAIVGNTFFDYADSFLLRTEFEGETSMALSSVAAFWLVALLLIIVPGPDWAFVLSAGIRARSVVPAVGGLALGYAGIAVVVAAGVGVLVARSGAVLTGLTVVGGCYLIWHGARTFARTSAPAARPEALAAAGRGVLLRGIGVSALNPKGLLLFLALLPQFTNTRGDWPLGAQLGLLGAVFVLTCAAFYLGLGSAARKVLHARPGAARAVARFSGIAMIAVGAALLTERLIA
jgi:threonine/homoserine/homoserine lactone efflux protein